MREEEVISDELSVDYLLDPNTPDALFHDPKFMLRAFKVLSEKGYLREYSYLKAPSEDELSRWEEMEVEPGLYCCQLTTQKNMRLKGLVLVNPNVSPSWDSMPPPSRLVVPIEANQVETQPLVVSACQHNGQFFTTGTDEAALLKDDEILRGGQRVFNSQGTTYGLIATKLTNYLDNTFNHHSLGGLGPRLSFELWCPSLRQLSESPSIALQNSGTLRAFLAIKTAEAAIDRFNFKAVLVGDKGEFIGY